MTITAKSVYTGGQWKPVLGSWVYQNGWKRVNKYSTYHSGAWVDGPLEPPLPPVNHASSNALDIKLNTFRYSADGGPVSSGGNDSNFLRADEYILYGAAYLTMQPDGNLVLYAHRQGTIYRTPLWSSHTFSPTANSSYYLQATSDGNYYIRNSTGANVAGTAVVYGTERGTWLAGGLRAYTRTNTVTGVTATPFTGIDSSGYLTVTSSSQFVYWDAAHPSGIVISPWGGDDYGINANGAYHPALPFYPALANNRTTTAEYWSVRADTSYILRTYQSLSPLKGPLVSTLTGPTTAPKWNTNIRAVTTPTANAYMQYELFTVSVLGVESTSPAIYKFRIGTSVSRGSLW